MTRRSVVRAVALLTVTASGSTAAAAPIPVRVVEVAGEVAYLEPGASAGVAAGDTVRFGPAAADTRVVIEVTSTAAVVARGDALTVGALGTVDASPVRSVPSEPKAAPRPLQAWYAQWPAARRPAETQTPQPVSLGARRRVGPAHATVTVHGHLAADRGGAPASSLEGRAVARYQVLDSVPLVLDLDLSGRFFAAGTSGARTPVWVRAAAMRLGGGDDPRLAVGRLSWVADAVGGLDGIRARQEVATFGRSGVVELVGFGGAVPNPIDGRPALEAARFGAELAADDPAGRWRPRVSLTVHGSTWEGELDERRATLAASLSPGRARLDAWAEVQGFDADNPWGASRLELTGAGASFDWRVADRYVGIHAGFDRPERSRRLAAALPATWLCWRVPGEAGTDPADEPCLGGDYAATATVSSGASRGRWSIDGAATVAATRTDGTLIDGSGFLMATLRGLPHGARVELGGTAGRASFLDWVGIDAGVVATVGRRWELSASYRPELIGYTGALDRFVSHTATVRGRRAVGVALDLAMDVMGTIGEDRDAVVVLSTLVWRPLP